MPISMAREKIWLKKSGGKQEQPCLENFYREAKALITQLPGQTSMPAHNPPSEDQMHHMSCYQQTTIFVLDTAICAPICTALACRTHQTACAKQPHNPRAYPAVFSPVQGSQEPVLAPRKLCSEAAIANDRKRGNFYGVWGHAPRKILKVKTKICAN